MIVKCSGDLPRIELFARQETKGWDVWGNQVQHKPNQRKIEANNVLGAV